MASSSVDGLISGLDTTTIISQLMTIERQPQDALKSKKNDANTTLSVYQALNTKFASLATAAQTLSRVSDWRVMKASSSSSAVVATATSGARSGVLSFTVQQLSRAGTIASTGTVASTSNVVASGPVLVAKGANVLGFSGLSAGAGLTVGAHSVEVIQATSGAAGTGTAALAATTTFAVDSTLDVTVNGASKSYTIAAGSYSATQLAAALQTASGGDLTASVGSDGKLQITTTREGSTASLAVTGGSAAAALFLDTGAPATTGTDGAVSVDGGAAITVTAAGPGLSQSLAGANGTIQASFAPTSTPATAAWPRWSMPSTPPGRASRPPRSRSAPPPTGSRSPPRRPGRAPTSPSTSRTSSGAWPRSRRCSRGATPSSRSARATAPTRSAPPPTP